MPKYYCDYCDAYLTHDSPSVRKTHNCGRKHRDNVKYYYKKWMETQAQNLIDRTTAEFQAGKIRSNHFNLMRAGVALPQPGILQPPSDMSIQPPGPLPGYGLCGPHPRPGMPMMGFPKTVPPPGQLGGPMPGPPPRMSPGMMTGILPPKIHGMPGPLLPPPMAGLMPPPLIPPDWNAATTGKRLKWRPK